MAVRRVLFLCSRNRLRSPTAEQVFVAWPDLKTDSVGLADDADTPVSIEQLAWANWIFVMEPVHRRRLDARYRAHLKGKRVVMLGIRDDYDFIQPELIELLLRKAGPLLRSSACKAAVLETASLMHAVRRGLRLGRFRLDNRRLRLMLALHHRALCTELAAKQ